MANVTVQKITDKIKYETKRDLNYYHFPARLNDGMPMYFFETSKYGTTVRKHVMRWYDIYVNHRNPSFPLSLVHLSPEEKKDILRRLERWLKKMSPHMCLI